MEVAVHLPAVFLLPGQPAFAELRTGKANAARAVCRQAFQEVFRRSGKLWDNGLEHRFDIDGVPCIVRIILRVLSYSYELWVDGKLK